MLDLEARVHLQKVEVALAEDELDSAGIDVAGRRHRSDGRLPHSSPNLRRHGRGGGLLHDLLVPALDRALSLAEVHHVAVLVGDHLDLDVPRLSNELFDVDRGVTESGAGRVAATLDGRAQLRLALDHLHADPAPAA